MPASYYKAPEGEDLTGKMSYALSRSTFIGLTLGMLDVKLYSKTAGTLPVLAKIAHWTWPVVGMSTAFVATTYIATNLRKKDDKINYALGGAVSGSIYGAWKKSAGLGLLAAAGLALIAVIKKDAVNHGFVFFPEVRPVQQGLYSESRDYTLTPYISGNWVRAESK